MKNLNIYILIILIPFLFCCKSENRNATSDLNLYFETTVPIDSIFISNITQDREFQFLSYSNPLHITLNDSINDLYNVNFYTKKGLIMNQMWLNGKKIIIKGSVSNKSVKIDTVIGSSLYYKSIDFKAKYKNLLENYTQDSTKVNNFLINELKNNIDNPLSIEIAEKFRFRNLNRSDELKKVFQLLSTQNYMLKQHLLNPYSKIENLLSLDKIDFSEYLFYDNENILSQINLPESEFYLVDFWFVSCPPCIKDHKLIKNKIEWLKDNDIQLIGISTDNNQEKWGNYLNKEKFKWINYREQEDYNKRITTQLLINVFPTYLLLDKEGRIIRRSNSFIEIEEFIKK